MSKNRKKLKDTAVGQFLTNAGSDIIGSLGDVLPDKGVFGLVKNLIKKRPCTTTGRQRKSISIIEPRHG